MDFLKLIRWQNLIMIALTQIAIRYFVVSPILVSGSMQLLFTHEEFALLVLSTISIAAAGYIINDYFDVGIDAINKPNKIFIGTTVSATQALVLHTAFSVFGIILGLYVGAKVGIYKLALIQAITVGLLWFYSSDFKKQFLIGNLIVALLTALVPMVVVIFEMPLFISNFKSIVLENQETFLLYKQIPLAMMQNLQSVWHFVGGFAAFAFLLTLIREIIKDIEDYIGDEAFGCRTIPVKLGVKTAKSIAALICIATIVAIGILIFKMFKVNDLFSATYLLVFLEIPLFTLCIMLLNASNKKQFARTSSFSKIIMLLGICYSFLFWWLMK
jgi:4-hydroxybenzoate polyprenyltransferase